MYIDERPGHKAVATDSLSATGPQKVLEVPGAASS